MQNPCDVDAIAGWISCAQRLPHDGVPAMGYAVEPTSFGYALLRARAPVSRHGTWPEAYDALVHHLCDRVVNGYDRGLAMHAACVSWRGAGLIIPGVSGAGKTTLTAWLLRQGLHYVTDELTLGGPATELALAGWGRPLRLKAASLAQVGPWAQAPGGRMLYSGGAFVQARCFGAATLPRVHPVAIVFPRRVPTHLAAAEVVPLSRAQAAVRLWPSVVNTRLLEARGMAQVTRLVRATQAFEWVYQDVDQLHAALARVQTLAHPPAAA